MTISNSFLVRIVADTELGRTAAATAAGSFSAAMSVPSLATPIARLDPFNPDGTDYPDCVGGTTTNGYSMTRAWIWASKAMFDTTTRRVLFVNSPHPFDAFGQPTFPNGNYNGYITLLTAYDEADNDIHVYESPFSYNNATWPRTVGHAFDNQCLVDRTLYKMTTPLWPNATEGWVQPQLAKIDIDQVTDSVASAREGEAYLGSLNAPWEWDESALTWRNPGRNLTAGALDYLPGSASLVFFHKKWLSFCPISTGTWTQPIDLEAQGYGFSGTYVAELGRTTWPIHNIGHYNAASGKFVCGGGAYNPDGASNHRYQLDWISVDATTQAITKLDDSPVIMSVSETDMPTTEPAAYQVAKVAACAGPNSVESLFFHDNGNVYGLNPFRPPGYQWRVVTTLAFEVDLCVPIDDYGVVLLFTSGANGTASMRVYKPPVAGDHTPPSIPLDVAATATSSSEITVTWSASTDPVIQGDTTSGLSGYKVYRGGTLVATLGNVLTYSDTGLSAGTAYSYTVSAYDVAGNESEVSGAASATTDHAAGGYAATHYVAPFASVSGASNDYTDLGATAWTNAQNSGTPTTLGTAMARATTGNKVQCAAGIYTKPWPGGNVQTPGFYPTNTGSAQYPIVFFAQTPAATNRGTPAAWSELRWTGAPDYSAGATGQNASILGCRGATGGNYVVFDGFAARRSYVPPMGSYGAMCTSATGTKFRRFWYDYEGPTPPLGSETDNWCVFWIRGSTDCVIEDCYFTGNTGAGNHNCAAITSYDANNFTIRNNTFYRMQNGIFVKQGPNYGEIYNNRFDTHGLCWVTVQSSHASNPVRVHHNLVIEAGYFDVDSSGGPSNQVMSVYGNTIVGASGVRWQADMDAVPASGAMQWYDNLLADPSGTVDVHIGTQSGVSFATLYNRMTLLDFNVYSDSGGSVFSDTSNKNWTTYRSALSGLPVACRETSSLATVVTFAGAGDYRLAANGQSALRASSTGGPVGCYVTGTEEIGVRSNPGY